MTGDKKRRPWVVATVSAIPSLWNVGADGVAIDEDEAFRVIAERDPGIVERWDEIERRHPGDEDEVSYHSVRQHLGIGCRGRTARPGATRRRRSPSTGLPRALSRRRR